MAQRLDDLKHRVWRRSPVPPPVRRVLWRWRNPPSPFVSRHLDGMIGIEIGASAHNDYGLRAINVDRFQEMDTKYKREEERLCGTKRAVDLVAPGDALPFRDQTVDFVFASHVIEHFPDPIAALEEWCRVAKHRVVLVVPHRDRTLDAHRELTSADELLQRHASGFSSDEDKHWSVWTHESFLDLCAATGFPAIDSLEPDDKLANGFAVVIDAGAARRPEQRRLRVPPQASVSAGT